VGGRGVGALPRHGAHRDDAVRLPLERPALAGGHRAGDPARAGHRRHRRRPAPAPEPAPRRAAPGVSRGAGGDAVHPVHPGLQRQPDGEAGPDGLRDPRHLAGGRRRPDAPPAAPGRRPQARAVVAPAGGRARRRGRDRLRRRLAGGGGRGQPPERQRGEGEPGRDRAARAARSGGPGRAPGAPALLRERHGSAPPRVRPGRGAGHPAVRRLGVHQGMARARGLGEDPLLGLRPPGRCPSTRASGTPRARGRFRCS
jgi:hypothetical protein